MDFQNSSGYDEQIVWPVPLPVGIDHPKAQTYPHNPHLAADQKAGAAILKILLWAWGRTSATI